MDGDEERGEGMTWRSYTTITMKCNIEETDEGEDERNGDQEERTEETGEIMARREREWMKAEERETEARKR